MYLKYEYDNEMSMVVFHASEGHLVPSHLGLAYDLFVDTNTFSTSVMLFSDFALRASHGTFSILCLPFNNRLEYVGYGKYIISID